MKIMPTGAGTRISRTACRVRRFRLGVALLAAVAVPLLALTSALPAAAAATPSTSATLLAAPPRVSFGVAPATVHGADGRPNFSYSATPGAVAFDYVSALNYSATPLSLQLYATDALETTGGGFGLLPPAATPTGVGSWITGLPGPQVSITVPADTAGGPGQFIVPFTLRVPDHVTPGDHVGGIVVSLRTEGRNASGQNIILNQRVGSRVFVQVAGKLAPSVTVTHEEASYGGTLNPVGTGHVTVTYVVTNTGNTDVSIRRQSVSVSGWIGPKPKASVANIALLLPGASATESAVLTGVWPEIVLHAAVTVHPTDLAGSGAAVGGPVLAPITISTLVWAIPWALLVLLLLLLVIAVVAVRRIRARRAERRAAEPIGSDS
jgi:hypothetical protein